MTAGASSAWAAAGDVTTNVDIDFSNAISEGVVAGTKNSMTIGGSNTAIGTNGGGNLLIGKGTSTVNIPEAEYAGAKDVVTVSFDLGFGKLINREVFFNAKDKDGNVIFNVSYNVYANTFSANTLSISDGSFYHGYNTVLWDRRATFTIAIDYKNGTIKTSVLNNWGGATANTTVDLSNTNPVAQFNVGSNYDNDGRRCEFDNLKITTTEGDYTSKTAEYTVKFVCDKEVINSVSRVGDVDSSISLFATDTENFFNDDESKRYIYVENDAEGKTVAEDGSTVVTVKFREADKYNYTVTTSYEGNALAYTATGFVWEDMNEVVVSYPRFQAYNETTLVEKKPQGDKDAELKQSITVTEDGFTEDFAYSATGIENLYLLSEAENLGTGLPTNATSFTVRVSNGQIIFGASGTLVTLPAGKYIFTLGMIGGDNSSHQVAYTVSAGNTQILEATCTGNMLALGVSEEFTLNGTTEITFTCSDPASSRGIDLVYIQKTGDAEETVEIIPVKTDAGYTTYVTKNAIEIPSGISAYVVAAVNTNSVALSKVESVPAGTAIIVEAAKGNYECSIVASAEEPAVNNLKASNGSVSGNGTIYALAKKDVVGFYPVAEGVTVPAGKAYIEVEGEAPVKGYLALGDEADAINNIAVEAANGAIYNIAGQKMESIKNGGLYIVNGKKVVVK